MSRASPADGVTGRFVRRSEFDRLAPRYERGSQVMSLGQIGRWRAKALRALGPVGGKTYVDVGAGTGEITRAILRAVPDARVVAVDASESMMRAGELDNAENVRVLVSDAAQTGLKSDSLDGAVSGFMLRHLPDPGRFLGEMRRVLRPGARLVLLEAHVPPRGIGRLLFHAYFYGVAWWLGALVTRSWNAHVGLRRSLHAFVGADAIVEAAKKQGWNVLRVERGRFTGFFLLAFEKRAG